ncbi:hypothetical protein WMY93_034218 [Mugilogobius chulae]|uniref:Uncharacterized protein n=1 Tax=Mugilogobius chulae TaxID=88201 RepID=A0AAW0MHU9_9GOBI
MELRRGDFFTWQVTLEGRSGALAVLRSLLLHCPELMCEETLSRLLTPLNCATALLNKLGKISPCNTSLPPCLLLLPLPVRPTPVLLLSLLSLSPPPSPLSPPPSPCLLLPLPCPVPVSQAGLSAALLRRLHSSLHRPVQTQSLRASGRAAAEHVPR